MNPSNTFLYNALDLLEHVGVFFIDPVRQVATVIQDLIEWKGGQKGRAKEKTAGAIKALNRLLVPCWAASLPH